MNNIILSIAVPMYNCEYSIGKSIAIIKEQLSDRNDVEIVICDNCSTDNSRKIVSDLIEKDGRFHLLTNNENLGMDKNVFKIVQNSKGEYVHIMSADDFYEVGGVQRIVDLIEKYEQKLDIIVLSNNYFNVFNNSIIKIPGTPVDVLCKTGGDLLEKEELKMLCLSNIVVKRSLLNKIKDWKAGVGILWPHLYIVSQILRPSTFSFVFSYDKPLVTVQFGNQGWVKKDALRTYSRAIQLYVSMINSCGGVGKNSIRVFLKSVISPRNQKSDRFSTNCKLALVFFKYYRDYYGKGYLIRWIKFSLLLLFSRKKSFFDDLEKNK